MASSATEQKPTGIRLCQCRGLSVVAAIAAGDVHGVALSNGGTVWGWGGQRLWSPSAMGL